MTNQSSSAAILRTSSYILLAGGLSLLFLAFFIWIADLRVVLYTRRIFLKI